ncbi:MAG TPA: GtrA family protein [Candidatus Saccharibacteria bacterium]|nr:GtrA family protein [Candidatus Saccharibacteria bacterium]
MRVVKTIILKLLQKDFVRFCIVGAIGFIVNATLLKLFVDYVHLRVYIAQALAAEIALFINFVFHHNWTYRRASENKSIKQLVVQFHMSSWVAILGSALIVGVLVNKLNMPLMVSLAISSLAALFWNFFWTKYVIWKKHITTNDDRSEGDKK